MTRKDYETIARAIRIQNNAVLITRTPSKHHLEIVERTIRQVAEGIARELARDNIRFDTDRFLKACTTH